MKRKILSLSASAISLVATALYFITSILFIVRLSDGSNFVPELKGDTWLVEVINRISKAGFNVFFTIMATVLCFVLALYRIMMAYFHFKVFRSDDKFYRERIKDNFLYATLSAVLLAVFIWVYTRGTGLLPAEVVPILLVLIIIYCLVIVLPIVEIIIYLIMAKTHPQKAETVPTREGILDELDDLADKTAAIIVGEKDDFEEFALEEGFIVEENSEYLDKEDEKNLSDGENSEENESEEETFNEEKLDIKDIDKKEKDETCVDGENHDGEDENGEDIDKTDGEESSKDESEEENE